MKTCSKCNINKKNSEFNKREKSKDKLQFYCKKCSRENTHDRYATDSGYFGRILSNAKLRAKKKELKFDLDIEYLMSIKTDRCPVFDIELGWNVVKKGKQENSPSLDRIIPELGYVKGNVVFISDLANVIKQNVTEKELYAVADWLHDKRKEVLRVFEGQVTSIPETNGRKSTGASKHRAVHGAGVGQDCDGSHHHIGE